MRSVALVSPPAVLVLGLTGVPGWAGEGAGVTALFVPQIQRCYAAPSGDVGGIPAEIEVRLLPDGSLSQPPKVLRGSPSAARAAVRAIERCAPFKIPPGLDLDYEMWKVMRFTFARN
jgi:colicin import membrane protein